MQKNKFKKLLHETHERLHIIVDNLETLEIWVNVNGDYEFVSEDFERLTGRSRAAFLRKEFYFQSLIHPDSAEQYRQDRTLMYAGHEAMEGEYRLLHADGFVKTIHIWWKPVTTRKGRHIGIRLSIHDLTAIRAGQEAFDAFAGHLFRVDAPCLLALPDGSVDRLSASAPRFLGIEDHTPPTLGELLPEIATALPRLSAKTTMPLPAPLAGTADLIPRLNDDGSLGMVLMILSDSASR